MAFTGNFMATSFKQQLLEGVHDFRASGGNTFKVALYGDAATLNSATTQYTTVNEVADSGSYVAGGATLVNDGVSTISTTAILDFQDASFTNATISAAGALIYNSTPSLPGSGGSLTNPAVAVLDFGGLKVSTAGTFTVIFPTPDATNAIIRIA